MTQYQIMQRFNDLGLIEDRVVWYNIPDYYTLTRTHKINIELDHKGNSEIHIRPLLTITSARMVYFNCEKGIQKIKSLIMNEIDPGSCIL